MAFLDKVGSDIISEIWSCFDAAVALVLQLFFNVDLVPKRLISLQSRCVTLRRNHLHPILVLEGAQYRPDVIGVQLRVWFVNA